MKSISLIIGSGFSVHDGIRSVEQINEFLVNLVENDFLIKADMSFSLLYGQKKSSLSFHWEDEKFFVMFLQWYREMYQDEFNYEVFYDFVTSFKRFGNHKNDIERFFNGFKRNVLQSSSPIDDINSYVARFSDYFNQLISNLLQSHKYYEDVGLGNYPPYEGFSAFLLELVRREFIVNNHSLNHDILFEHIASNHSDLFQYFTDGYTEFGSPYYGNVYLRQKIAKIYKVRLKYFNNHFDKPIRLFKLHGSVDTYIANLVIQNLDLTRVKKDFGVGSIQKEVLDVDGRPLFAELYQNTYPDILSGTSSKILWYQQPYYKELQEHFTQNLSDAELLLVIGYGFRDDGINNIIESKYLSKGKKMIVIDIKKPSSRLIYNYRTEVYEKSFSEVSLESWMEILENNLV